MRKSFLTFLLFAFSCTSIYATEIVVTTGEDEASGHSQTPIVHGNYYNYVTQQIYTASELGGASNTGTITSIYFHYKSSGSWCTTNRTNLKVYLNTTSASNFNNGKFIDKGTEVYSSTSFNTPESAAWYELEFTTPFVWDGVSNIVVTVIDNSNARVSISPNRYHYVYSGTARAIFMTGGSDEQINTSITGVSGTSIDKIANAKFAITLADIIVPAPTSPSASSITRHSATLGWTAAAGADSYEVRYGTTSGSLGDATNVGNVTSYEISGLEESTTYYYQIRTKIGDAYSAWTTEASFTTLNHTHNAITFTKWNYSGTLPTSAGNYYLTHNVTLSGNWEPAASINLCLNGHTVSMGENYGLIDDNITVAIYDEEGGGKITSSNSSQTLLASGSFTNLFIYADIENTGSGRKVKAANGAIASIDEPISLSEAADNAALIAENDGLMINVSMTRSLTSSQYNTFCLPFALSDAQLQEYFGAGYDLEEFVSSELDGDLLSLTFSKVTALTAGKPYLLKPAVDVANPTFEAVTLGATSPVDQTSDTYISFIGTYAPTELEGGNKNLLFLGADNTLFWPASTANLKGFRAYFEVKGVAQNAAKRARIVQQPGTATGIENQMVNGKCENGKYIKDGQLFIIRDGKTYNILGLECK